MQNPPEAIANYHCQVGENPLWDDRRGELFWTDIPAGRLFRYDPASGSHRQFYQGEPVGGFTFQQDGKLLLFGVDKISRLDPDTGAIEVLVAGVDERMDRFNDVIADPRGRVFAGTMAKDMQGGLFRVDPDGRVTCLFRGTNCANGMGFSPDRRRFYWTDSTAKQIFQFEYHEESGDLTDRKVVVDASGESSTPDGMTVDAEGNLWSARWGGSVILKYDPGGKLLDRIDLPVSRVSSAAFGGRDLCDLYATTAGGSDGSLAADGTLYRVPMRIHGLPDFRSRVLL